MTRRIRRCAVIFGICLIFVPVLFAAQPTGSQSSRRAQIRTLAEQLRWRSESGRKRYEAEKAERTHELLAEIDQYIAKKFVPNSVTPKQVQSDLNDVLGYKKGLGIQNVAFIANLPRGSFLIVGVDLWRGGAAISEDYICFRAYADLDGRFVHVASTANLSDSQYLGDLHAGALEPTPITGEFWFISWADIPPQSPYTVAIRLYAFDGRRFRTIWAPQDVIATSIDKAVEVGPSGVFTVNHMHNWKSSNIVHEQYAISENKPKKTKEWTTRRD